MKIAHLTYDMRIGGTEKVIVNIVLGSTHKLSHHILCIEEPLGPFAEQLIEQGIPITSWSRKPGFDTTLIRKIRRYLKAHQIDVLHCHQYTPWSYGALACVGLRTKVIFTEHGRFYPDKISSKRAIINPVLAFFTDAITAISNATKQALVRYEYLPERAIQVIYNGIEPLHHEPSDTAKVAELKQAYSINSDSLVIGSVSRFDPIKNHALMIKATAKLIQEGINIHLMLVGDGEMRASLEAQINQYDLAPNVTLTGYVTYPKNHLQCMDLFLLTSFSEGTSMTLLEALSLGIPVVVTNVGGNPEIVQDNEQGKVIENDDVDGLVQAIRDLMDERFKKHASVSAKQHFETHFTDQLMIDNYLFLYKNITKG